MVNDILYTPGDHEPNTPEDDCRAVGVMAIAGWLLYARRQRQAEQLYAKAAGIDGTFAGNDGSRAAVERLAEIPGERVTAMLLALASKPDSGDSNFSVQVTAINLLVDRKDSTVAAALARLLRPQTVPPVRKAVADALWKAQCMDDCTASILHYLERTSQGEANVEDRRTPSIKGQEEFWNGVRTMLARDEQAVYDSLYLTLRQQGAVTTQVLTNVYGLGTDVPSKFALSVVSRTRLTDACPPLLNSRAALEGDQNRKQENDDVVAAIHAVGCK